MTSRARLRNRPKKGSQHSGGGELRCSKCGFENPAGMRFCGHCTEPLALVCPKCRFRNPPGFTFCGQCAAALSVETEASKGRPSAPDDGAPPAWLGSRYFLPLALL